MLARQQASVILEKILGAHDKRWTVVERYSESISSFKERRNKDEFVKSKRGLDDQFKGCTETIGKLSKELQGIDTDRSAKVREKRERQ